MKIRESLKQQEQILKEISAQKGVDFITLKTLIDSVKTKKLLKRNNYHQQKIIDVIEKTAK